VLSEAIDEVEKAPAEKKDAAFQRFVNFFEAVLALPPRPGRPRLKEKE
jgi:CRISPR/Cas system CSM-associated protein Csm2 small subunit